MVPFAVIGALLLVTSVVVVGSVQVQEANHVETDAKLAVDRTDAAVQTALRSAVERATIRAGEQPVTESASTPYGTVLESADGESSVFERYLKALVYLEAVERFDATGQQIGTAETTVSLPPVNDSETFEEAINRVSLSKPADGLLTVTVSNVTVDTTHDGERIDSREESLEVTIPTPLFQLHERTEQYQERLDASVMESGFTQRLNARLYALGWARGYAQYAGAPVTEVIANRHVEPAVNDALYRTQRDVFGATDPTLSNAVRRGWLCMAAQDADSLYEGYTTNSAALGERICEHSQWVLGDEHTGELPDAPGTVELLGEAPGMDTPHTIGVNETAYLPLRTLLSGSGGQSLDGIIERVFTVDGVLDADVSTEPFEFEHEQPADGATVVTEHREHVETTVDPSTGTVDAHPKEAIFYEFADFEVTTTVREHATWEWTTPNGTASTETTTTGSFDTTVTVRIAEDGVAPNAAATDWMADDDTSGRDAVRYLYEPGPTSSTAATVPTPSFPNLDGVTDTVTETLVGGTTGDAFADWLETEWNDVTARRDLTLAGQTRVSHAEEVKRELRPELVDEITTMQEAARSVTHTFERGELVHEGGETDSGPVDGLIQKVTEKKRATLDREQPYENMGQFARYETRHAYFQLLLEDLERVESGHNAAMGELDDALTDIDDGLDGALTYLQQGLTANEPEPTPLTSPDIVSNVSYEVRGTPTYLTGEPVTNEEIPQIDQNSEFAPLATKNENLVQLPHETVVEGLTDSVLSLFGWGNPDASLSFQVAGEALRAGELTTEAQTVTDGDNDTINEHTEDLRAEVDVAIEEFTDEFSRQLAVALYPTERPPAEVTQKLTTATENALATYDGTAKRAIALGNNDAATPIGTEVSEALTDEQFRPDYSSSETQWKTVISSLVRPTLVSVVSEQTVSIENLEQVEALDESVRKKLSELTDDIVAERLETSVNDSLDLEPYDDWVGGVDSPVRMPSGMPLLPVPGMWYATVNSWDVHTKGAYKRFELRANVGAPDQVARTYVREEGTVPIEIEGRTEPLGIVEPIAFSGRSVVIVVVPPGGVGIGDKTHTNPECSPTYPVIGDVTSGESACR